MAQSSHGQIINNCTNVVVQLVFCDGFIDDGLEMRRPVARAKREDQPDDQIVFSVTTQLLYAAGSNRYLPKSRKQINERPYSLMPNLKDDVSNVGDGEATPFCAQVERSKINDQPEFFTPWFRNWETG